MVPEILLDSARAVPACYSNPQVVVTSDFDFEFEFVERLPQLEKSPSEASEEHRAASLKFASDSASLQLYVQVASRSVKMLLLCDCDLEVDKYVLDGEVEKPSQ